MKTKRLYQIWQVKESPYAYALVDVITALVYTRDQVISTDYEKLQKLCDRLNFMAGEDERYEVRDVDDELSDLRSVYRKR